MFSKTPVNRMVKTSRLKKRMGDSCVQYFEGVEKLLEIWFASEDNTNKDLRKIPRLENNFAGMLVTIKHYFPFYIFRIKLESLLKIVRCEIISFARNDQIDAYVLR